MFVSLSLCTQIEAAVRFFLFCICLYVLMELNYWFSEALDVFPIIFSFLFFYLLKKFHLYVFIFSIFSSFLILMLVKNYMDTYFEFLNLGIVVEIKFQWMSVKCSFESLNSARHFKPWYSQNLHHTIWQVWYF